MVLAAEYTESYTIPIFKLFYYKWF